MLDTSAFRDALNKLQEMVDYTRTPKVGSDERLQEYMRTALIQAYEFSYEMATKAMKRCVDHLNLQQEIDSKLSYQELLRSAYEYDLISDISPWIKYRDKRNITSHAYAEDKAIDVVSVLPAFIEDARFLLESVERRAKDKA